MLLQLSMHMLFDSVDQVYSLVPSMLIPKHAHSHHLGTRVCIVADLVHCLKETLM